MNTDPREITEVEAMFSEETLNEQRALMEARFNRIQALGQRLDREQKLANRAANDYFVHTGEAVFENRSSKPKRYPEPPKYFGCASDFAAYMLTVLAFDKRANDLREKYYTLTAEAASTAGELKSMMFPGVTYRIDYRLVISLEEVDDDVKVVFSVSPLSGEA
jgi:hypothetical protein